LLDEPTNHLDLRAKDVLLEALLAFTGTVVFVSHDRYFIDKLATKVFEVGSGAVSIYPGNYEDYLWRKQRSAERPWERLSFPAAGSSPQPAPANGAPKPPARINPMKLEQMKRRLAEIEQQTAGLESEIGLLEAQLAGAYHDHREAARLSRDIEQRRARLTALLSEWEQAGAALEQACQP
ncbi:MAG TPA: ABC transporter ATP-binding protein, partial [Bryobacterales bacterium]|nr:ABC transporter ATP-binding protein [Bryobacterales bacterium]